MMTTAAYSQGGLKAFCEYCHFDWVDLGCIPTDAAHNLSVKYTEHKSAKQTATLQQPYGILCVDRTATTTQLLEGAAYM